GNNKPLLFSIKSGTNKLPRLKKDKRERKREPANDAHFDVGHEHLKRVGEVERLLFRRQDGEQWLLQESDEVLRLPVTKDEARDSDGARLDESPPQFFQ